MAERIAILCIANNYGPPRTAQALTERGVEVCIVAPPGSYAALTRFKHADLLLPRQEIQAKLPSVVGMLADEFRADLILAGDDIAFAGLARLVGRLPSLAVSDATRAVLARSMPPADRASILAKDSDMVMARASAACPSPPSLANPTAPDAARFASEIGFPVLVKRDGFSSGRGVTRCEDTVQLTGAIAIVEAASSSFGRGFVVQKFLSGTVYGASVASAEGGCLGAFTFIKHVVHPAPFGPTAVAKARRHEAIIADVHDICERFGVIGFAGFDYVVDAKGQAHFLEINPRIMPTSHLGEAFGLDLCAALLAHLRGQPLPLPGPALHDHVALFPNEWLRDPNSTDAATGLHDEPRDDPNVRAAMMHGKG